MRRKREHSRKFGLRKALTHGVQAVKEELDRAEIDLDQARRAGDLARMSEIQYGVIPTLEKG